MTQSLKNGALCILLLGLFGVNPPPLQAARDCQTVRSDLGKLRGLIERKNFLEVAITICPDDPVIAYYNAYNFDRRQQFNKALVLYKEAVKLNGHYAKPHFGMGDIYLIQGKMDKAISAYEKGLVIDPKNSWAKRQLDDIKVLAGAKPSVTKQQVAKVKPDVVEPGPLAAGNIIPEKKVTRIDLSDLTEIAKKTGSTIQKSKDEIAAEKTAKILASAELVSSKTGKSTRPVICKTDLSGLPAGDTQVEEPGKDISLTALRQSISLDDLGKTYTLHFNSDSSLLTEEARALLDEKVCMVMQHPSNNDVIFEIAGYADSAGSFDLNMSVSRFRAYVVKNYLVNQCSIPEERLYLLYFGETNLLVPDNTPENHYLNRRVEIRPLDQ